MSEPSGEQRRRFEELTRDLVPDLYRYAFWLSRNRETAEEAVQETLLRAWRKLDSLREDSAAKPWLLTILRREHARLYERDRPETVDVDTLTGADERALATGHNTDVDDVRQAIFELEDEYREPLVLQVLQGYKTEEIADLMGLKQQAVLTRLFRARKKVREILEGRKRPGSPGRGS